MKQKLITPEEQAVIYTQKMKKKSHSIYTKIVMKNNQIYNSARKKCKRNINNQIQNWYDVIMYTNRHTKKSQIKSTPQKWKPKQKQKKNQIKHKQQQQQKRTNNNK